MIDDDFRPMYGYLDENNNVVPTDDVPFVAAWEKENWPRCQVGLTEVGAARISTVFLRLRHYGGMWFETLVLCDDNDTLEADGRRYRTHQEALEGHAEFVAEVTQQLAALGRLGSSEETWRSGE